MNHEEINSAVEVLRQLIRREPSEIDAVVVAEQFRRISKAGLPINHDRELREMRDRAFERIGHLRNWPMSDSPERAKYLGDSDAYFHVLAGEAWRRAEDQS